MYRQLNYDLHGKAAPEIVSLMIKKLGLPESRSTRGEIIRLMKYLADFESKIDIPFKCLSWVAKYGYNCLGKENIESSLEELDAIYFHFDYEVNKMLLRSLEENGFLIKAETFYVGDDTGGGNFQTYFVSWNLRDYIDQWKLDPEGAVLDEYCLFGHKTIQYEALVNFDRFGTKKDNEPELFKLSKYLWIIKYPENNIPGNNQIEWIHYSNPIKFMGEELKEKKILKKYHRNFSYSNLEVQELIRDTHGPVHEGSGELILEINSLDDHCWHPAEKLVYFEALIDRLDPWKGTKSWSWFEDFNY